MKRAAPTMLEIRNRASDLLALVNLGISGTYAFTPPARGASRASVVAYVERLGPIWIALFLASGLALVMARVFHHQMVGAHTFAFSVAVFYSAALWASVILSDPFSFSVSAWASLAMVGCHYLLSRWYASGGER